MQIRNEKKYSKKYQNVILSSNLRHTNSAVNSSDIDAAAMEFERRFHISVDDSADQQVRIVVHFEYCIA